MYLNLDFIDNILALTQPFSMTFGFPLNEGFMIHDVGIRPSPR